MDSRERVFLALDFFLVAPVFVGDYGMFGSLLGMWIPMGSIFVATTWAGAYATSSRSALESGSNGTDNTA